MFTSYSTLVVLGNWNLVHTLKKSIFHTVYLELCTARISMSWLWTMGVIMRLVIRDFFIRSNPWIYCQKPLLAELCKVCDLYLHKCYFITIRPDNFHVSVRTFHEENLLSLYSICPKGRTIMGFKPTVHLKQKLEKW